MTAVIAELSLREWAAELEAAATIARSIAGTAFLPESHHRFFRDDRGRLLDGKDGRAYRLDLDATTATAAAAIMTGAELGLPPGAALRSITVINNTPALSALALRAILQHAGHDIWVDPSSNATKAVVRARRDGGTEVQASTWTIDRAKTAGLYPGAERSQWRRNPAAMLVARASAEAARWIAADSILGIPYTVEEIIDEIETPEAPAAIDAAPPAAPAAIAAAPANGEPKKRRRRAAPPPALPTGPPAAAVAAEEADAATAERASAEPADAGPLGPLDPPWPADAPGGDALGLDGGTEVVDEATGEGHVEPPEVAAANARVIPGEVEPEPGKITRDQMARLHAGLREILVTDKDEALGMISLWAGRTVESTRDLTEAEGSIVLTRVDALRGLGARKVDEEGGGNGGSD